MLVVFFKNNNYRIIISMDIDFYTKYININFDNCLLENNNELVNSEEFYLKYKKIYISTTQQNYELYKNYQDKFKKLNDFQYSNNNNKYNYIYIDDVELDNLKINIKKIIIEQDTLLNNFNHYISLLNDDKLKFKEHKEYNKIESKNKGFLSKIIRKSSMKKKVKSKE